MATITDISVTDDDAGTNTRVFSAVMADGGKGTWALKDANTIFAGIGSLQISLDQASSKRATNKVKLSLAFPKEVDDNGTTVVNDTGRVTVDVVVPTGFTATDIENMRNLSSKIQMSAVWKAYLDEAEPVY